MGKFPGKPSKIQSRRRVNALNSVSKESNESSNAAEYIYLSLGVFDNVFGSEEVEQFYGFTDEEIKLGYNQVEIERNKIEQDFHLKNVTKKQISANKLENNDYSENFITGFKCERLDGAYRKLNHKTLKIRRGSKKPVNAGHSSTLKQTAAKKILAKAKRSYNPVLDNTNDKGSVTAATSVKKFVLPSRSAHSSRVIKPNKKFIATEVLSDVFAEKSRPAKFKTSKIGLDSSIIAEKPGGKNKNISPSVERKKKTVLSSYEQKNWKSLNKVPLPPSDNCGDDFDSLQYPHNSYPHSIWTSPNKESVSSGKCVYRSDIDKTHNGKQKLIANSALTSPTNGKKVILRQARLNLKSNISVPSEGPFSSGVSNSVSFLPIPGTVECGVCGAVRFYRFVKQARKFGIFTCESCRKFISRLINLVKTGSSTKKVPLLECHNGEGTCSVPAIVRSQQWKGNHIAYKARCPACWLQKCLRSFKIPDYLYKRLLSMFPSYLKSKLLQELPASLPKNDDVIMPSCSSQNIDILPSTKQSIFSTNNSDTLSLREDVDDNSNDEAKSRRKRQKKSLSLNQQSNPNETKHEKPANLKQSVGRKNIRRRIENLMKINEEVSNSLKNRKIKQLTTAKLLKKAAKSLIKTKEENSYHYYFEKKRSKEIVRRDKKNVSWCAIDDPHRQKVDRKGPRVKHVCRSASVVLGQQPAVFSHEVTPEKKLLKLQNTTKKPVNSAVDCSYSSKNQEFKRSATEIEEYSSENVSSNSSAFREGSPAQCYRKIGRVQQIVLPPEARTLPQGSPSSVEPEREISIDFWETYDPDEVCNTGFGLIGTEDFRVKALCFLCGSAGREELVHCALCCEPYHPFCIIAFKKNRSGSSFNQLTYSSNQLDTWRYDWICQRCTICSICSLGQGQQLCCQRCHLSYHIDCLGPERQRSLQTSERPWICPSCLRCKSCGAEEVSVFVGNLPLCNSCFKLRQKGNFCPLCQRCYDDNDFDTKMMECAQCKSWIHAKCEGLSDEHYQILSYLPEFIEFICRSCCMEPPAPWWHAVEEELKAGYLNVLKTISKSHKTFSLLKSSPKKEHHDEKPAVGSRSDCRELSEEETYASLNCDDNSLDEVEVIEIDKFPEETTDRKTFEGRECKEQDVIQKGHSSFEFTDKLENCRLVLEGNEGIQLNKFHDKNIITGDGILEDREIIVADKNIPQDSQINESAKPQTQSMQIKEADENKNTEQNKLSEETETISEVSDDGLKNLDSLDIINKVIGVEFKQDNNVEIQKSTEGVACENSAEICSPLRTLRKKFNIKHCTVRIKNCMSQSVPKSPITVHIEDNSSVLLPELDELSDSSSKSPNKCLTPQMATPSDSGISSNEDEVQQTAAELPMTTQSTYEIEGASSELPTVIKQVTSNVKNEVADKKNFPVTTCQETDKIGHARSDHQSEDTLVELPSLILLPTIPLIKEESGFDMSSEKSFEDVSIESVVPAKENDASVSTQSDAKQNIFKNEQNCSEQVNSTLSPKLLSVKMKINANEYDSLLHFHQEMEQLVGTQCPNILEIYRNAMSEVFPWFDPDSYNVSHNKLDNVTKSPFVSPVKRESTQTSHSTSCSPLQKEEYKFTLPKRPEGDIHYYYSGFNRQDVRVCMFCKGVGDGKPHKEGRMLYCGQNEWTHSNCAIWSAEVFEEIDGSLQNVLPAVSRGRLMRCYICNKTGASVGCCSRNCIETYHFPCALSNRCTFTTNKTVYCPAHKDEAEGRILINKSDFILDRPVYVELDRKKKKYAQPRKVRFSIGSLFVDNLGEIVEHVSDHREFIIPVNLSCSRWYWSVLEPWRLVQYHMRTTLSIASQAVYDVGNNITVDHTMEEKGRTVQTNEITRVRQKLFRELSDSEDIQSDSLEVTDLKPNITVKSLDTSDEDVIRQLINCMVDSVCRDIDDNCLGDPQNTTDLLPPELKDAIFEDLPHDILDGISMQDIFPKLLIGGEDMFALDTKNDCSILPDVSRLQREDSEDDMLTHCNMEFCTSKVNNCDIHKSKRLEVQLQTDLWSKLQASRTAMIDCEGNTSDTSERDCAVKDTKLDKSDNVLDDKRNGHSSSPQKPCSLSWNCRADGSMKRKKCSKLSRNSADGNLLTLIDSSVDKTCKLQEFKFSDGILPDVPRAGAPSVASAVEDSVELKQRLGEESEPVEINMCSRRRLSQQKEEGKENKCMLRHNRCQVRIPQLDGAVDSSSGSEDGSSPCRTDGKNMYRWPQQRMCYSSKTNDEEEPVKCTRCRRTYRTKVSFERHLPTCSSDFILSTSDSDSETCSTEEDAKKLENFSSHTNQGQPIKNDKMIIDELNYKGTEPSMNHSAVVMKSPPLISVQSNGENNSKRRVYMNGKTRKRPVSKHKVASVSVTKPVSSQAQLSQSQSLVHNISDSGTQHSTPTIIMQQVPSPNMLATYVDAFQQQTGQNLQYIGSVDAHTNGFNKTQFITSATNALLPAAFQVSDSYVSLQNNGIPVISGVPLSTSQSTVLGTIIQPQPSAIQCGVQLATEHVVLGSTGGMFLAAHPMYYGLETIVSNTVMQSSQFVSAAVPGVMAASSSFSATTTQVFQSSKLEPLVEVPSSFVIVNPHAPLSDSSLGGNNDLLCSSVALNVQEPISVIPTPVQVSKTSTPAPATQLNYSVTTSSDTSTCAGHVNMPPWKSKSNNVNEPIKKVIDYIPTSNTNLIPSPITPSVTPTPKKVYYEKCYSKKSLQSTYETPKTSSSCVKCNNQPPKPIVSVSEVPKTLSCEKCYSSKVSQSVATCFASHKSVTNTTQSCNKPVTNSIQSSNKNSTGTQVGMTKFKATSFLTPSVVPTSKKLEYVQTSPEVHSPSPKLHSEPQKVVTANSNLKAPPKKTIVISHVQDENSKSHNTNNNSVNCSRQSPLKVIFQKQSRDGFYKISNHNLSNSIDNNKKYTDISTNTVTKNNMVRRNSTTELESKTYKLNGNAPINGTSKQDVNGVCLSLQQPNKSKVVNSNTVNSTKKEDNNNVISDKMKAEADDYTPNIVYEIQCPDGFVCKSTSVTEVWQKVFEAVQNSRRSHNMPPLPRNPFNEVANSLRMLGVKHNGLKYLMEQLPGISNTVKYKPKYHKFHRPAVDDDYASSMNTTGCARTERFRTKSQYDMFSWLASRHRKPPKLISNADGDLSVINRRATSSNLPMAMRFRHLKETSKEAVGVYRSHIHGRGLFCLRDIEMGEMVIEYAGEVIRSTLTDKREKYYESKNIGCYMFRIDDQLVVDATMRGNAARFINHSCEPNCYSRIVDILGKKHILIFALRRILQGEELTYDYKFPFEDVKIPCTCGSRKCRKYLN